MGASDREPKVNPTPRAPGVQQPSHVESQPPDRSAREPPFLPFVQPFLPRLLPARHHTNPASHACSCRRKAAEVTHVISPGGVSASYRALHHHAASQISAVSGFYPAVLCVSCRRKAAGVYGASDDVPAAFSLHPHNEQVGCFACAVATLAAQVLEHARAVCVCCCISSCVACVCCCLLLLQVGCSCVRRGDYTVLSSVVLSIECTTRVVLSRRTL